MLIQTFTKENEKFKEMLSSTADPVKIQIIQGFIKDNL